MTRFALSALALGLSLASGCASIVGDSCATGYAACGGVCIDVTGDPRNCGACGRACALGVACSAGVCGGDAGLPRDGSVADADAGVPPDAIVRTDAGDAGASPDAPDAAIDGAIDARTMFDVGAGDSGAPLDAGVDPDGATTTDAGTPLDGSDPGDAATTDGSVADAGDDAGSPLMCSLGELECSGACVDVGSSPMHCGACGVACGPTELCQAGTCVPRCAPGLIECGGACVDPSRDADHCGGCFAACGTGVCIDGACSAPFAGHYVVVGHDYRVVRAAMNRIVGNAVFLGPRDPAIVLVYEGAGMPTSIAGTDMAINEGATRLARRWTRVPAASPAAVPLGLADADVFLVYAQHAATDAELDALGVAWAPALSEFLGRGGVVVMLDGASSAGGTPRIASSAGLLTPSATREDATDVVLRVLAPADQVVAGVPLSYRGELSTIRLVGADAPVIVGDATGGVVLHRVVVP